MKLAIASILFLLAAATVQAQPGGTPLPRLVIPPISTEGNLPDGFYAIRRIVDAKNNVKEFNQSPTKESLDMHDGNMRIKFNGRNIRFHETICEVTQTTPSSVSTNIQATCGNFGDESTIKVHLTVFSTTHRIAISFIGNGGIVDLTKEFERFEEQDAAFAENFKYFDSSKWREYSGLKTTKNASAPAEPGKKEWLFSTVSINNNRHREFSITLNAPNWKDFDHITISCHSDGRVISLSSVTSSDVGNLITASALIGGRRLVIDHHKNWGGGAGAMSVSFNIPKEHPIVHDLRASDLQLQVGREAMKLSQLGDGWEQAARQLRDSCARFPELGPVPIRSQSLELSSRSPLWNKILDEVRIEPSGQIIQACNRDIKSALPNISYYEVRFITRWCFLNKMPLESGRDYGTQRLIRAIKDCERQNKKGSDIFNCAEKRTEE